MNRIKSFSDVSCLEGDCKQQLYMVQKLSITVIGASGDLARKKTFPTLFELYSNNMIPRHAIISGYARSKMANEEFHALLRKCLEGKGKAEHIDEFISKCVYFAGQYDSNDSFKQLHDRLYDLETSDASEPTQVVANRLFYFAIPPNVFIATAGAISSSCRTTRGWNRLIVEKPFGRDLQSALLMSGQLMKLWREIDVYRIDHYLGSMIMC